VRRDSREGDFAVQFDQNNNKKKKKKTIKKKNSCRCQSERNQILPQGVVVAMAIAMCHKERCQNHNHRDSSNNKRNNNNNKLP
jgi:hypothetical protein